MNQYIDELEMSEKKEESKEPKSKICVLHSRYASRRGTIRDDQAHPIFDEGNRVAVFHNGFITNYKELFRELFPKKDPSKVNLTDSELIAAMLGKELDNNTDLKTAITNLVEKKLIGTWRLAIIPVSNPNLIYFTKNAGDFLIGTSNSSMLFCTDKEIQHDLSKKGFQFQKMKNNILYCIDENRLMSQSPIQKNIEVDRKPSPGYSHIFEEEIRTSLDAIEAVTDHGAKFISNH